MTRASPSRPHSLAIAGILAASPGLGPHIMTTAMAEDTVIAPEKNPPGDIPDSQVFIEYRSPLGFTIKVPEGWARRETKSGVTFSDKYNTVRTTIEEHVEPLTIAVVKNELTAQLEMSGKAVRISGVTLTSVPSGPAIVISYASNSDANPVTNKAIRLENERYFFWKGGKLTTLTLSAPYGADDADQWLLMAKSFRWL